MVTTKNTLKPTSADKRLIQAAKEMVAHYRGEIELPMRSIKEKPIKVPLDADIIVALRASGKDWQMRLNGFLHTAIEQGQL